jgi:hypothetical protein
MFIAKANLFLNCDRSNVLRESDKGHAFLLTTAGAPVSDADVEAYGLEKYVTQPGQPGVKSVATKKRASKKR